MPASNPPAPGWLAPLFTNGPLPLQAYMAACLYDPTHGYYATGRNFQGTEAGTDFLTAPTLTPLFGAAVSEWVARQWQALGAPASFTLAEAGPGNGALMKSLYQALAQNHPTCAAAANLHLIESSPALSKVQQQTLQSMPAAWHLTLQTLPPQPTLLIANELLDAFPVAQYQLTESGWQTHAITLQNGILSSLWQPSQAPQFPPGWQPQTGAVLEISSTQHTWLSHLKTHFQANKGAALLIDYGYPSLPPQGGDTLQALHAHQPVSIFHQPGQTDLTTHVNFAWVAHLLGGQTELTDLTPFLLSHNLLIHAEPLLTQPGTEAALHRLIHPARMGSLFKALNYRAR